MEQFRSKTAKYRLSLLTMLLLFLGGVSAYAQQTKITGTVKDPGGEPLIGVSVRNLKTGVGAVTDLDGNYSIEVPAKSTLSFSYIGFETIAVR